MRKTLIALLFASTLPAIAVAMPDDAPHNRDGQHAYHEQLDLTKQQRSEMRKLMGEQIRTHREIIQRYLDKLPEAERKAMQEELASSKEQTHTRMRDLLKPEQQTKFDELQKKMEAKRAERADFKQ